MSAELPGLSELPWARRLRVRALAALASRLPRGPATEARARAPRWLSDPVRRALAPLRLGPPHPARVPIDAMPPLGAVPQGAPRASVIVPTRGSASLSQCVAAIRAFTRVPHELILVDDAAGVSVEGARVLRLGARRGFVGAANQGARHASTRVLVFLNDDAVVTPGWLGHLLAALDEPRAGLAGPASNDAGDDATSAAAYRDLDGLLAHARGCSGAPREVPKLSLLCAAIDRALFETVGGLDEGYGLGLFEDDELCRQLRRRRRRVLLAPRAFVHHHGSLTFGALGEAERIARFEINRYRFERRWRTRWRSPV